MIYRSSYRVSKYRFDKVGSVFTMVILSEFHMRKYRDSDHREGASHFIFMRKYPKSVYLFAYDAGINQLFSLFADWLFNNNQFVFAEMIAVQIFQTWLQSVTKCPRQLMENDGNRRR